MATGLPHESELERDHYDLIGRLIDHEKLLGYLRTAFGERLGSPTRYPMDEEVPDRVLRAAQGYAYLHKIITDRAAAAKTSSEPKAEDNEPSEEAIDSSHEHPPPKTS